MVQYLIAMVLYAYGILYHIPTVQSMSTGVNIALEHQSVAKGQVLAPPVQQTVVCEGFYKQTQ